MNMHFKVTFLPLGQHGQQRKSDKFSQLEQLLNKSLVEFKNLRIDKGIDIAERYQSIQNSQSLVREFVVTLGMGENQRIDFNMESPEADSMKGLPRNSAIFLYNDSSNLLSMSVHERHFKLERDEEAFLKQL